MKDILKKCNSIYLGLFCVSAALIFYHFESFGLALYGDEIYYARTIQTDLLGRLINHNFGHPPLWSAQILLAYNFFGTSYVTVHIIALIYSILLIVALSLVLSELKRKSLIVLGAIFLVSYHGFFIEAILSYSVNAAFSFVLFAFYYRNCLKRSLLFCTLAALTLESGLLATAVLIASNNKKRAFYLIPIGFFIAFYLMAYLFNAQELINPALVKDYSLDKFLEVFKALAVFFETLFNKIKSAKVLFVTLILSPFFISWKKSKNTKELISLCVLSFILYSFFLVFLYLFNTSATRDFTPIIIFFIIIVCSLLKHSSDKVIIGLIFLTISCDFAYTLTKDNYVQKEQKMTSHILSRITDDTVVSQNNFWRLESYVPFIQRRPFKLYEKNPQRVYCSHFDEAEFKKRCQMLQKGNYRVVFESIYDDSYHRILERTQ